DGDIVRRQHHGTGQSRSRVIVPARREAAALLRLPGSRDLAGAGCTPSNPGRCAVTERWG
ncbi:MAG: hypothetical protein O2857_06200, partial [Planctomycetota bacterium]|nr:hypothetical protein [Planctomycetota bacterium]